MERRAFLGATLVGSVAATLVNALPRAGRAAGVEGWRAFEVITRVEILNPSGTTRAWIPLPLGEDTDYQKTLGHMWSGNEDSAKLVRDPRYGLKLVAAEWPAGTKAPTLEVLVRVATRDRRVDPTAPGKGGTE